MENFVLYDEICTCDDQVIYKARRKGTINFLAISCIDKKRRTHVTNHVRFARALKHEYVLKFHEWYETSNHLWVVMDLCTGGTLEKMLREDKMFPEFAMVEIGRQLVAGLQFIHSHGVIFADWFPTRIFFDGRGNIKYYDFSYARMVSEEAADIFSANGVEDLSFDGLSHFALPYAAPEVLSGASASRASDIWSLGCIFFRMFFGVVPFSSQVPSHLIQMICTREVEVPIQCTRKPSLDLWSLLCAMLTKDPKVRITLDDTWNHSFWLLKPSSEDNAPKSPSKDGSDRTGNPSNVEKQDASASSIIVRRKNGVVNVNGRGQSLTEDDSIKTLKRSVSMGDSALVSAALLRKKNSLKKTPAIQKDAVNKGDGPFKARLRSDDSTPTDNGTPVGEANFTLHAQACPVSMRSGVLDTNENHKASLTASSNDESVDMSSRSTSKITATPDSAKRTFFESNDSLQPPTSPIPNEERMIKSEYVFRNSDTSGRFGSNQLHRSPLPDRIASIISPQTRARIALLYPWGDDASTLPREATISIGRDSRELEELFVSDELEEFNSLPETNEKSYSGYRPKFVYTPQPLGDYKKWFQNPPKAELRLPLDLAVLSPSTINSLTHEEINSYSSKLLTQMMDSLRLQDSKSRPSTFLSYVVWFLAVTTLESRPPDPPNQVDEISAKDIVFRIKYYLSGAASLLRLDSISTIVKTWLFRIISLLIYRSTFMIQQDSEDPDREALVHTLIVEVVPELSSILSTVVDILREPAYKSVFPLKQAGIVALGELLTCEMCIHSRILLDPTTYEDLTPQSFDIPKNHWQAAVLRLIRFLSPPTLRSGNASQYQYPSRGSVKPLERGNSSLSSSSKSSSTASANEDTCRLAAARVLNETVIVVIGCKLMRLLQLFDMQNFDRDHPGVQLAVTVSSSLNAFLDCLLTPETISRVWADGVMGGGGGGDNKRSVSTSSLNRQIAQASVSALTGLIRLRPSLFMCGLIDRNGTTAFMHKLNPTNGAKGGQDTTFMACLLSATTTGLILPLSFHNKPLGASLLRVGMNPGTPAACRRLLTNSNFLAAVMRQLESPHAMLRAKAYLLAAAALNSASSACSETLIAACDARLPSCLERDLKMTNQHYTPRSALDENSVFLSAESRSHSQMTLSTSPGLQYLGICVKHLADLLVYSLIPNICKQVAIAIGAYGTGVCNSAKHRPKLPTSMASSTYQERTKRTVSSAGQIRRSPMTQGSRQLTSTTTHGVSLRTCLPAFFCLPGILTSSASVRNRLLLPPHDLSTDKEYFCLIEFIATIFDHWASSMGTLTGVHRPDSPENQLLNVTLALAEDISRQIDVVEGRRADLIKALLPAIARLAVAPASDSITRTICVKIILDMKNIWCGGSEDTDSLTSSNISLNLPKNSSSRLSGLVRSPLSSDRLNSKLSVPPRGSGVNRTASLRGGENKRPVSSSSSSSVISTRSSSRVSSYRPNSFYGSSSTGVKSLKSYKVTSTLKNNFQGPSPEVLLAVVDIVNNLLIPYASLLLDLHEITPSTYFLRLLLDCLQLSRYSTDSSLNHSSCINSHLSLVKICRLSNLPLCLIDFVTGCDCGPRRFSVQCFLALRLLSTLTSHWPHESGLFHLILAPCIEQAQNPLSVVYNVLVSMGGYVLRHERRKFSDASIHHPSCHSLSVTPSPSQESSVVLKISAETVGVRHLLVALELLNTLLNLLTDVVRYALRCRQSKCADRSHLCQPLQNGQHEYSITDFLPKSPEDACSVAERLLSLSRPPKHLPGILASLLEASSSDSVDRGCTNPNADNEQEVAASLVTLSTRALASLASLYGGEYCRTALSAAGLRGFTVALRRNGHRDGKRLLLRILRRLSESDHVCLGRMAGPAAKHLHSVIWKLRSVDNTVGGCVNQDSVTIRLARSLLEHLQPRPSTLLI